MHTPAIRLAVELDPCPEDLENLRAWPWVELVPDLAAVAAGWVRADWEDGASERVGDHALYFLFAFLDSIVALSQVTAGECSLDFGDGGGSVMSRREGDIVHLTWEGGGAQAGRVAAIPFSTFVDNGREAARSWLAALADVNPRLGDHPDVGLLREALEGLPTR